MRRLTDRVNNIKEIDGVQGDFPLARAHNQPGQQQSSVYSRPQSLQHLWQSFSAFLVVILHRILVLVCLSATFDRNH